MAFPSPSQLLVNFQTYLRSLKPSFNPNDPLSDFNIRGKAVTGIMSGLYADQEAVDNDTFITDARDEATIKKAADYGLTRQPATVATTSGMVFTGTPGTVYPAGQQLQYGPTGNIYQVFANLTVGGGGSITGRVDSTVPGQKQNVSATDTFTVINPPTGGVATATLSADMGNGTNIESIASLKTRLTSRLQNPPAGGNANDYQNWAFAADPSVRGAFVNRFGRGLGTVDIYITSGTTDIDGAVTAGDPVVRLPSGGLVSIVQAYYDAAEPLCDCAKVFSPVELAIAATVYVDLIAGLTLSSVPANSTYNPLNLTVSQLVQREVGRVLYKYAIGGRKLPGVGTGGYIVATDLSEGLEHWLSSFPNFDGITGLIPILTDWRIAPLDGMNTNLAIAGNALAKPGTITVTAGT